MTKCKHCAAHLINAIKYCYNCGEELVQKGDPKIVKVIVWAYGAFAIYFLFFKLLPLLIVSILLG